MLFQFTSLLDAQIEKGNSTISTINIFHIIYSLQYYALQILRKIADLTIIELLFEIFPNNVMTNDDCSASYLCNIIKQFKVNSEWLAS